MNCDTCRFWDRGRATPIYHRDEIVNRISSCRFNPPSLGRTLWPQTLDNDICGRWKPIKEETCPTPAQPEDPSNLQAP